LHQIDIRHVFVVWEGRRFMVAGLVAAVGQFAFERLLRLQEVGRFLQMLQLEFVPQTTHQYWSRFLLQFYGMGERPLRVP
jgi:hypothetical protein